MECLGAERGSLILHNRAKRNVYQLQLAAARGLPLASELKTTVLDKSAGVLGQVLKERKPLVSSDILSDCPDLAGGDERGYTTRSCLCVPVIKRDRILGIFSFTNRKNEMPPFAKSDLQLIQPMLDSATVIIAEGVRFNSLQLDFMDLTSLALVKMVETRLPWRQGHSQRVAAYSREIARRLGLTNQEVVEIERAANIHDIGLIGVKPELLSLESAFGQREREITEGHTSLGWKLLQTMPYGQLEQDVVLHHHERMNGNGYPDGLNGSNIPLPARIVAAADVFDALTSPRPHRPARTPAIAIEEISAMAGSELDPEITVVLPEIIRA